ncbi:MAG: glycerophosphoryl diester phosphodiesterase membrane domain-containing protein [Tissierellia bacterium]|nr:glycerophosphoryl diester phosphodiesterase membrane domain-containing protein [Tissierellia bacterium]
MKIKSEKNFSKTGKIIWMYTKYQIITKGLLALVIIPIFTLLLQYLIKSSGRTNISSGDYLKFLFSFQGLGLLLLALLFLIIIAGLDINAFIIMSALIKEDRLKINAKDMLLVGIKSIKSFLKPSGIFLLLYVALIIPLVSIGFTITPMKNFQIPNFITSVIFNNSLYKFLYIALMLFLSIITYIHIFTFHYILILNKDVKTALKQSRLLMKKHWMQFAKDALLNFLIMAAIAIAIIVALFYSTVAPAYILPKSLELSRFLTLFTLLTIFELISFLTFMTVPIIVTKLTELFYKYNAEDNIIVEYEMQNRYSRVDKAFTKIKFKTKLAIGAFLIIILAINSFLSAVLVVYFDEVFNPLNNIEIIAHRGGGDLGAENSIAGLEAAIKEGAAWSEIDVQRTKDFEYIINHDPSFSRVAGVSKKSIDLTLDEIKELEIKDLFNPSRPSQRVATLEEFLDAAKGRIGLFVELKGETADQKMVDDVVSMIRLKQMENETVLLSLDYEIIKYIEDKYPDMKTGYLYFFSIGETWSMKGDYLIMEEREATPERISRIQASGKKAIVWTVNTEKSINKFVRSDVDGIITDHVKNVKAAMETIEDRTDIDLIMDTIFGE